jgi:hypothetical protein
MEPYDVEDAEVDAEGVQQAHAELNEPRALRPRQERPGHQGGGGTRVRVTTDDGF